MKNGRSPKISVLTPVYNGEQFIQETIESVLSQTFADFEFLLMDDGSTDNSREIILSCDDPRIKFIQCPHHFVQTLNTGLLQAKGQYIALLDHDDIMMPYRLQMQYDFMESHPEIAVCGGYMYTFGQYSKLLYAPTLHDDLFFSMIKSNPVLNPTCFIRREFLKKYSIVYRDGYSFAADYKFWFEVAKVGKLQTIPEILTLYRTSKQQTSIKYMQESIPACFRLQEEIISYFLTYYDVRHSPFSRLLPIIRELVASKIICHNENLFHFIHQVFLRINHYNKINHGTYLSINSDL